MKKVFVLLFVFLLVLPSVFAAQDDSKNKTKNITNIPGEQAIIALNASLGKGNASNVSIEARLQNIERIQERILELGQETVKIRIGLRIREYVKTLKNISEVVDDEAVKLEIDGVAAGINDSVKKILEAEENIKKINPVMRILIGRNRQAVRALEREIEQNERRIEKLEKLQEKISEDLKELLQLQISALEEENQKLNATVVMEKQRFSLFGWLFR